VQEPDPVPRPLDHLTLCGLPDAPALLTKEGALDFAGLEQEVGRLAASLLDTGLEAGDRVATWLPKNRMTSLMPLAAPVSPPSLPTISRQIVAAWTRKGALSCSRARGCSGLRPPDPISSRPCSTRQDRPEGPRA
jgi:hypothetical protein